MSMSEINNIKTHMEMMLTEKICEHAIISLKEHELHFKIFRLLSGYDQALEEKEALEKDITRLKNDNIEIDQVASERLLKIFKCEKENERLREALEEAGNILYERGSPPLKIDCPECGAFDSYEGDRVIKHCHCDIEKTRGCEYCEDMDFTDCNCQDGQVWNWLTPEQYEEHRGTKMLDSDPVWWKWEGMKIQQYVLCPIKHLSTRREEGKIIIVARPGQPAPPAEWRPK